MANLLLVKWAQTPAMEPAYQLRRLVRKGGAIKTNEYRLYGPGGACLLTATAKATPYLPVLDIVAPDGRVCAKLHRGKLLNYDIVLTSPGGGTIARIALPRIQTAFHKKPFAVTGPQDEPLCQLLPRSALPKLKGEESSLWDTVTDNDLLILRDGDVLGYTARPGLEAKTGPSVTDVAMNIATLPIAVGKLIYRELAHQTGTEEYDDGSLHLTGGGWPLGDELALLTLLFRRYDYRAKRSIE